MESLMGFETDILKFIYENHLFNQVDEREKTNSVPRKTTEFRKQRILNDEKKFQSDQYLEETTTVRHKTAHHREFES